MKKLKICIYVIFILFFLSCQTPFTPENPEAKSFAHLQNPIVFSTPIIERQSLLKSTKGFSQSIKNQYYICIFDADKGDLYNKRIVSPINIFQRAFQDATTKNFYFMAYGKDENDSEACLLEFNSMTGDVSDYINGLPPSPAFMQRSQTTDGRVFISSYLCEKVQASESKNEEGFSLSVFNVFTKKIVNSSLYLPEPYFFNFCDGNNFMYFSMQGQRVGGYIRSDQIFKMDLSNYSYKEIYSRENYYPFDMLYAKDKLFVSQGRVNYYADEEHTVTVVADEDYAVILDAHGNTLLQQRILGEQALYNPYKVFEWNNDIYMLYGGINQADPDGKIRNWLYKYNESANQFERIESEALFGVSMRNMVYVCGNKLVMIDNLEAASFKAAAVDLNTMTQLYNKEIILY